MSLFSPITAGRCKFLHRSCVNWRERNRRVIVTSRVSFDTRGISSLPLSRFFASRRTTTTTTRSHFICASGALFLISPRVIRVAAVLQFIRRRWQRQPPAGNSGLIKFTDAPSPLPPSPSRQCFRLVKVTTFAFHLGKATIRVTIRFSRSPEVGAPKPRPPLGSRARVVLHYKADLFFFSSSSSLCSLLYAISHTLSHALFLSGRLYATIGRTKRAL